MTDRLHTLWQYLRFRRRARGARWLHSPFVFELYRKVLRPERLTPSPSPGGEGDERLTPDPSPGGEGDERLTPSPSPSGEGENGRYVFPEAEQLRRELLRDKRRISVRDLGAGSRAMPTTERQIAAMARHALASRKEAERLYRLAQWTGAQNLLELGTSLGLTTAYLARARPQAVVHTLEGCPNTLDYARQHFERLGCSNIKTHSGDIAERLPEVLVGLPRIDFLLMDANHRYRPTLAYFTLCLPKLHADSVVVVDDIYWSKEMTAAWNALKARPEVSTSVDIFTMGLLFFHHRHPKQDFVLR